VTFKDWKSGAEADSGTFAYKAPSGSRLVPFSELANIGELPAPAPLSTGERK
jgi:hypothetical protein